jgi:hypothetical protein
MIWYDFAVIKLNNLFESIDHIGLTQKLDASLRLWLNCGTVNITVAGAGSGGIGLVESKTLKSQRIYARVGEREDKGGV